jgi:hypothetical protein
VEVSLSTGIIVVLPFPFVCTHTQCQWQVFSDYLEQKFRILRFTSRINELVDPRDPITIHQKIYDTHPCRASPRITHQRHAKDVPLFLKLFVPIHQVFLVLIKVLAINFPSTG